MRDSEQVIPATAKTDDPGETPPEAEHHQNVSVSLCGSTLSGTSVLELPHADKVHREGQEWRQLSNTNVSATGHSSLTCV